MRRKQKHLIVAAMAAAALALTAAAEARERHKQSPVNVAAENHPDNRDYRKLKIIFYGPLGNGDGSVQGRYAMCNHGDIANEWHIAPWSGGG